MAVSARPEETGREMNRAIAEGDRDGLGMGEALGAGWIPHPRRSTRPPACYSRRTAGHSRDGARGHWKQIRRTPIPARTPAAIGQRFAPRFPPVLGVCRGPE